MGVISANKIGDTKLVVGGVGDTRIHPGAVAAHDQSLWRVAHVGGWGDHDEQRPISKIRGKDGVVS